MDLHPCFHNPSAHCMHSYNFNTLYILEHFWIYRIIAKMVQMVSIYCKPVSAIIDIVHLSPLTNEHWCIFLVQLILLLISKIVFYWSIVDLAWIDL